MSIKEETKELIDVLWIYVKAASKPFSVFAASNVVVADTVNSAFISMLFGAVSFLLINKYFSGLAKDVVNAHDAKTSGKR